MSEKETNRVEIRMKKEAYKQSIIYFHKGAIKTNELIYHKMAM